MNELGFYNEQAIRSLTMDNQVLKRNLEREYRRVVISNKEKVIYDCFNSFKADKGGTFADFKNAYIRSQGALINQHYPVAGELFSSEEAKLEKFISTILKRFSSDKNSLVAAGMLPDDDVELSDIHIGLGDFHNGQSTSILETNKGQKLIYKPNNGAISGAYHQLLSWLNEQLDLGDYQYKVLNKESHHWQEFVDFTSFHSEQELSKYYYRAGIIACVAYVLNAVDFHFENLIVRNAVPMLIDHETIIRAQGNNKYNDFFIVYGTAGEESVLDSMLLPTHLENTGVQRGMCGFGDTKEQFVSGLKKESLNRFSDDWKFVTRTFKSSFIKHNIPEYQGERIYANRYVEDMLHGFEACYRLFMDHKSSLINGDSTLLNGFENKSVRFIWRATNVYAKILDYMKLSKNLKDHETYKQKIRGYLAQAFKKIPAESELQMILESELIDMYRGDIPYFEIDSSSRNLKTKKGEIKDFFSLSCVENIKRKLNELTEEDLSHQKGVIQKCYELDEEHLSVSQKNMKEEVQFI